MARKTDGEKIDELESFAAALDVRIDNAQKQLEVLDRDNSDTAAVVADLRRDYQTEFALLKREVEELKKWREEQKRLGEERSRRLWAFGPNLVAALVGGLIAAAVAYFTRHL